MIDPGAKVFITGATGAAGTYVVPELVAAGYQVTALVRAPMRIAGVTTVVGELPRVADFCSHVAQAGAVVHLASTRSQERDEVFFTDVRGTMGLADYWVAGPFVYASSQTVYGVPRGPLTEDTPCDALEWYDLGKLCGEFALRKTGGTESRGPAISLRPPLLFSPRPGQFLDLVFRECASGRTFFFDSEQGVESYGSSYVGAADFASAVRCALQMEAGGPYNVGAGFCRWIDLIEAFARAGMRTKVVIRKGGRAKPDESRLPQSAALLDSSKFCAASGWQPRQHWHELVAEFLAARARSAAS